MPPKSPFNWLAVALAILSLVSSIYLQASRNDRENTARISALEAHQGDSVQRLDRIETKVDAILIYLLKLPKDAK